MGITTITMTATVLSLLAIALNAVQSAAFPTAVAASDWTKLADGPYSAREGLMAVVTSGGKIVMTGGRRFFGAAAVADAWASDNGTEWKQLPAVPWKARAYHAMMEFEGCIYVMGGQEVAFTGNPFYNDVWKSCDDGQSWEPLGNAPWETRAGIAFTVYKGKMWVAGGCYHSSIGKGRYFLNDVWSSSDGVSWEQMTANASWTARSGARLVVHNDKLMLIAGEVGFTPDTQLGDIWTSADGKDWEMATQTPGFAPRSGHGVVVVGETVYVIAGWVNNLCIHDMWTSTDGVKFELVSNSTWDCTDNSCGKFDFWPLLMPDGNIITMGGSNAYATFGKMWKDTWQLQL